MYIIGNSSKGLAMKHWILIMHGCKPSSLVWNEMDHAKACWGTTYYILYGYHKLKATPISI